MILMKNRKNKKKPIGLFRVKKIEDEINVQLDCLQKLMDVIPNPIFIKNINEQTMTINKAFSNYFNKGKDEITLNDMYSMIDDNKIFELSQAYERAITLKQVQEYNLVINGSDGGNINIHLSMAPYTDVHGKAIGVVGTATDITHISKIEEELRQSENKYKKLVQMAPDTVLIHNKDKIIFINELGVNLLGYNKAEEIIGESLFKFIYKDDIDIVKQQIEWAINNPNVSGSPFDLKIISEDGRTVDVEAINIAFTDGSNVSTMVVIRDITERKRTEELKKTIAENARLLTEAIEYDRIKNEFFANISHELRTPLNVILGVLQLLIIYSDKEAGNFRNVDRYLNMMKQNCYRLLRLVNNLIDITKIDAGFFQMKLRNYDVVRIVEDITLSVADYIEEQGLTLEFDTNMEERIIKCDPDQMERIILNLLSNSIKFTSPGGKISVFLDEVDDYIEIRIKDTGIGIPEDKLEFIFERFRQVDKSLTRDHEGSGIGLSLVKSLVEMHGGTINVTSQEDSGTEFIIKIPADKSLGQDEEETVITNGGHIERIKVEFSDIYSV